MRKILIIGPIGDFGGRELESGFIAKSLMKDNDVMICSTGNFTSKSQIFDFVSNSQMFSVNNLVFENSFLVKIFTFFSWIKNKKQLPIAFYIKSKFNKRFLDVENHVNKQIKRQIEKADLILICGQLSSNYIETIINYSYDLKKKVFFRTTGTIKNIGENQREYLKKVTKFLHHSRANAFNLNKHINLPYAIIDQCAYNEDLFLQIEPLKKKVKIFISISRLAKEKNIDIVIKAFLEVKEENDKLFILGDGPEMKNLKKIANQEQSIIFTGFVSNKNLNDYLKISDCIIISSNEETGPLTGIEAMAAGKIIISAKVGAMPERLPNYKFWFDQNVLDLKLQIKKVKELNETDVFQLSEEIRGRYQKLYSEECIAKDYREVLLDENIQ